MRKLHDYQKKYFELSRVGDGRASDRNIPPTYRVYAQNIHSVTHEFNRQEAKSAFALMKEYEAKGYRHISSSSFGRQMLTTIANRPRQKPGPDVSQVTRAANTPSRSMFVTVDASNPSKVNRITVGTSASAGYLKLFKDGKEALRVAESFLRMGYQPVGAMTQALMRELPNKSIKAPLTADQRQKFSDLAKRQFDGHDITTQAGREAYTQKQVRQAAKQYYGAYKIVRSAGEWALIELSTSSGRYSPSGRAPYARTKVNGTYAECQAALNRLVKNNVARVIRNTRTRFQMFFDDTRRGFHDPIIIDGQVPRPPFVPGRRKSTKPGGEMRVTMAIRYALNYVGGAVHKIGEMGKFAPRTLRNAATQFDQAITLLQQAAGMVNDNLHMTARRLKTAERFYDHGMEYINATSKYDVTDVAPEFHMVQVNTGMAKQYLARAIQEAERWAPSPGVLSTQRFSKGAAAKINKIAVHPGARIHIPPVIGDRFQVNGRTFVIQRAYRFSNAPAGPNVRRWAVYAYLLGGKGVIYDFPATEDGRLGDGTSLGRWVTLKPEDRQKPYAEYPGVLSTTAFDKSQKDIQRFPAPRNDYQIGWNNAIGAYSQHGTTRLSPSMAERQDANNLREFMRGWNEAMRKLAREAGKALGEGMDTAGGYLVPNEHGSQPIEMLLPTGKGVTTKAGAPTPPPGGKVHRQTAVVSFDSDNLRADLKYGYVIDYDFANLAQVKRFMGQAQAAGFRLGDSAEALEAHGRQEMGIPLGIDWRGTLNTSKQAVMRIAAELNSLRPKNVTFKLVDGRSGVLNGKPSMAVYADRREIGAVSFAEHAQALYQLAKRIGAKVRGQSTAGMMPLSAATRPTGKSSKAMPPLLPGGQGYSGRARASLRRAGAPPDELVLHWRLEYEQIKEYKFQTVQEARAFMAIAKRAGYRLETRSPANPATPPSDSAGALTADIQQIRAKLPIIKTVMEFSDTFIIEHHHGKGFIGFGMQKPQSGGRGYPTATRIVLKTEEGARALQRAAQTAGWKVVWR